MEERMRFVLRLKDGESMAAGSPGSPDIKSMNATKSAA